MSTFEEQGFLSDEVKNEKWKVEKYYEKEFSICNRLNILLMEMTKELNPDKSRKELLSNMLTMRFCQSLQSVVILLGHAINSDSHSIIRNMLECYLALACLLKDEEFFVSINEYDEMRFKLDMILFIEKNSHIKELYKQKKSDLNDAKKSLSKMLDNVPRKEKPMASVFYKKTKDEPQSQRAYLDYKSLSNTHCHISTNSFLQNYKKDNDKSYVHYRGIYITEMHSIIKKLVDVCVFFAMRLDEKFFHNKYNSKLESIAMEIYNYYTQTGVLVHKDNLTEKYT